MSAHVDELAPVSALDVTIELRFAELELQRIAAGNLRAGRRLEARGVMSDANTLGELAHRLEAGTLSTGLGALFLEAAQAMLERYVDELETSQ